jgi:hypothetical protein
MAAVAGRREHKTLGGAAAMATTAAAPSAAFICSLRAGLSSAFARKAINCAFDIANKYKSD